MRLTVHLPDVVAEDLMRVAVNEAASVSSVVALAVKNYVAEKHRRRLGRKVLAVAGKTKVHARALELLHRGRDDARS